MGVCSEFKLVSGFSLSSGFFIIWYIYHSNNNGSILNPRKCFSCTVSIVNNVFLFADTLLDDFLLTYPVFMSTSDLCQALLGQYPSTQKYNFIRFTHHNSPFYRAMHVSCRNRTALLTQSCVSLNQHHPPLARCILHLISANLSLHLCYGLNLKSHLLHQALQSERGWEGGSGEETQSPAPGVTVDGSLQRFPEGGRTCQTLHEGRKM